MLSNYLGLASTMRFLQGAGFSFLFVNFSAIFTN